MTAENKEEQPEKKKGRIGNRLLVFSLMVTACVFHSSTIVLGICMVPSIVAAMVDRQPQKTAWITVGSMNFAGTLPAWFMLWEGGHTIEAAFQIIANPSLLLIAYGGAAIGWFIYNNVTPLVAAIVVGKNERRLRDISKRQKELVRKWGEDVASRH